MLALFTIAVSNERRSSVSVPYLKDFPLEDESRPIEKHPIEATSYLSAHTMVMFHIHLPSKNICHFYYGILHVMS